MSTRILKLLDEAAGKGKADFEPLTRIEAGIRAVAERIDNLPEPSQEQINEAVGEYLDEHGVAVIQPENYDDILQYEEVIDNGN